MGSNQYTFFSVASLQSLIDAKAEAWSNLNASLMQQPLLKAMLLEVLSLEIYKSNLGLVASEPFNQEHSEKTTQTIIELKLLNRLAELLNQPLTPQSVSPP